MQPLWKAVWRFLRKLKIELPYDPAVPLLGIHLDKTTVQTHRFTPLFIAALFTIAKPWKQPTCRSTDGWIKVWCVLAKSLRSSSTLWNPMDCSPQGSSVHGILQARILDWIVMSSSRDLPDPGIEPASPAAPAMQADSLLLSHLGSLKMWYIYTMEYYS